MRMKELDWQGRTILVRRGRGGYSGHMECDGFKATLRELEVLRLKAMGLTHREIARELIIQHDVPETHLYNLKNRNCRMVEGRKVWPSTMELINRAEELELLNLYAVKGLKSILEKI